MEEGFALDSEVGLFAMKREVVYKLLKPFDEVGVEVDIVQLTPLALFNWVVFDQLRDLPTPEMYDADNHRWVGAREDKRELNIKIEMVENIRARLAVPDSVQKAKDWFYTNLRVNACFFETATELAGEPILAALTVAPGNGAGIGGLKVVSESARFAARPSGTENVYKIYAESFRGPEHLAQVQAEAMAIVDAALQG